MKNKKVIFIGLGCVLIFGFILFYNNQRKMQSISKRDEMIANLEEFIAKEYIPEIKIEEAENYVNKIEHKRWGTKEIDKQTDELKKMLSDAEDAQKEQAFETLEQEIEKLKSLKELAFVSDKIKKEIDNRTAETSSIFSDDPVVEYQDTIEDIRFYRLSVHEGEAKAAAFKLIDNQIAEIEKIKNDTSATSEIKNEIDEEIERAKQIKESEESDLIVYDGELKLLSTLKDEMDGKLREQKIEEEKMKPETYVNTPSFEELSRNPENYFSLSIDKGFNEAKVKFSGKVLQVIEDTDRNQMRLAIDSDYDKVILVSYEEDRNNRVLEDDILTVYGNFNGIRTYTTVLGDERSIPFINANMIQQ